MLESSVFSRNFNGFDSVNFQANHEELVLKNLSRIQCQHMGFLKIGCVRMCKFLEDFHGFSKPREIFVVYGNIEAIKSVIGVYYSFLKDHLPVAKFAIDISRMRKIYILFLRK